LNPQCCSGSFFTSATCQPLLLRKKQDGCREVDQRCRAMAFMPSPASPLVPRTPAILQGDLAPWGPTPSPSPMIRLPQPPIGEGSTPKTTPEEPVRETKAECERFTQELLVDICAPYIERMIQALYQAVEEQLARHGLQEGSKEGSLASSNITPQHRSPEMQAPTQNDPFSSLFEPATRMMSGRSKFRRKSGGARGGGPTGGAFREEDEPQGSSNSSTPRNPQEKPFAGLGRQSQSQQQQPQQRKATDRFNPSADSANLVLRPAEADVLSAAGGLGSRSASANASPVMPGIDSAQLQQMQQQQPQYDSSGNPVGEGMGEAQPLYLAWDVGSEPQRGMSHEISPLMPTTTPHPQTGAFVLALGRQSAGQDGGLQAASSSTSPPNAGAAAEKSVMVCRHWKSKGWCRMEADCKFLHPDHKRGVPPPAGFSAPPGSGRSGSKGASGGCPDAASEAANGEAAAASGKSRTRRAGRGRHSGSAASGGTTGAGGGGGGGGQNVRPPPQTHGVMSGAAAPHQAR